MARRGVGNRNAMVVQVLVFLVFLVFSMFFFGYSGKSFGCFGCGLNFGLEEGGGATEV